LTSKSVEDVLSQFVGEIEQIPPMYSAKKINGKKLYKLARQGKTIERSPSLVEIHAIDLLSISNAQVRIKVQCGKGTYIRVLAEDIANSLGTVAYVEELKRIAVGDYCIEDAISIPEFIENWKSFAA
jgi:tRNA pseudouridine55 synthase